MKTKAAVSQYVLVEIKTPGLKLLGKEYRTGCYGIHPDLTDAVSHVQKTAFDFRHYRAVLSPLTP